jgi:4-hydroxyproline epimerase
VELPALDPPAAATANLAMQRIAFVDSHTAGEPTRVVHDGGPDLGTGPLDERRQRFAQQYDALRRAVVHEPRGSDVLVGALLCPPSDPRCTAGVIFFNNVGYLGMCGHGLMGVVVTLGHLGRLTAGRHLLQTPVGIVAVEYDGRHRVTVQNVPARRTAADVPVEVPGFGTLRGDVAWGGNWFFLTHEHGHTLELCHAAALTDFAWRVRRALAAAGITGDAGQEIDHIELLAPAADPRAHSRNFVLCPGGAFDRSPCGTGTSAHLACLHARGRLRPGQVWIQEGILGSQFEATFDLADGQVVPRITGSAYLCAEGTLLLEDDDPFRCGIPSG